MQLNNKLIDNLVTMIKQQQNDTANLLINMAFDWQEQITAISQRTQLLFKSTNTIAHLQSKLDNLLAAVETLTTRTLTSCLIHTQLCTQFEITCHKHLETAATHFTLFTNTPYIIIPTRVFYIGDSIIICSSH